MSENQTSTAQPVCLPMALLCLAALASACGSDPLAAPTPHSYPIPGCETLDVTPCDTQKRDCQVSRFQLAACLRGTQAGTLPLVTVMTEQAYVDYTNGLYEGRELVGTNHFELAMVWLGLAQPGSFSFVPITKESIANWFGTYRWRGKDLLLIDHGKPTDDEASNVALVAAWIRALRDRDINIGVWTTVVSVFDVDSNWGADAMYFGEARFYSNRYKASLDGIPPADEFAQINASIRDDIAWTPRAAIALRSDQRSLCSQLWRARRVPGLAKQRRGRGERPVRLETHHTPTDGWRNAGGPGANSQVPRSAIRAEPLGLERNRDRPRRMGSVPVAQPKFGAGRGLVARAQLER